MSEDQLGKDREANSGRTIPAENEAVKLAAWRELVRKSLKRGPSGSSGGEGGHGTVNHVPDTAPGAVQLLGKGLHQKFSFHRRWHHLQAANDAIDNEKRIVDVGPDSGVVAAGRCATALKCLKNSTAAESHSSPSALMGKHGTLREMAAFGKSVAGTMTEQ